VDTRILLNGRYTKTHEIKNVKVESRLVSGG